MSIAFFPRRGMLAGVGWQPYAVWRGYARDLNGAAIWAGITAFILYTVGLVPVQTAVIDRFCLASTQVSSWIFIISPHPVAWQSPSLVTPTIAFTLSAFVSVTVPLVVFSMGLGRVQCVRYSAVTWPSCNAMECQLWLER